MKTDDTVQVNHNRDLGCDGYRKRFINKRGKVIRQLKNGCWLVDFGHERGEESFGKANLDIIAVSVEYPFTNPG